MPQSKQGNLLFPYRQWVRLDAYIEFDSTSGYAKLWQNGKLISYARVEGGRGYLAQAHFGLYASAAVPSGTVYNDKLRIKEVADEAEALALVNSTTGVLPSFFFCPAPYAFTSMCRYVAGSYRSAGFRQTLDRD